MKYKNKQSYCKVLLNILNNNKQEGAGTKKSRYKWTKLRHNGVLFPKMYESHNTPIIYNGNKKIILNKEAEEYATLIAKYIETEYYKSKIFLDNFWYDWKKTLKEEIEIDDIYKCDFRLIYKYILENKEKNKTKLSKSETLTIEENKYKIAYIDDKEQPVGNYKIEPPSIFIGRGCHPKIGRIKKRIYPTDIIINIGKGEQIPKPNEPYDEYKWKKIIHNREVEWLASWKDKINNKTKYVWLANNSEQKMNNDKNKFNIVKKLDKYIKQIREDYNNLIDNENIINKQIGIAIYLIDTLALRIGNEKGEDEADTVGVLSLRLEHIQINSNNTIELNFLGKDSVRYYNKVVIEERIKNAIIEIINNKKKDDFIFDKIEPNDINKYLQQYMKELTAKVFRTYNATNLLKKELEKITKKNKDNKAALSKENEDNIMNEFYRANIKVAILCNHQKNINKKTNKTIENINEKINKMKKMVKNTEDKKKKRDIKKKIKILKIKKDIKLELSNISLNTSIGNYIDPRIIINFCKDNKIEIKKIFSKRLEDKFKWAIEEINNKEQKNEYNQ